MHAQEKGCLLYQLAKDPKAPGAYTVIELYEDSDAVSVHQQNLKAQGDSGLGAMLASKPTVLLMPVVGPPGAPRPADVSKWNPVLCCAGLKPGPATKAIVATLPIKPDLSGRFENATLPLLEEVQAREAGTLLYCLSKQPQSGSYVFTELYVDGAAIKHHGGTAYFKAAGKAQAPCFAGRPSIQVLDTVGPGGAKPTAKL